MGTKISRCIHVVGARQNNLKNIDIDLPSGELIVVTGVSGSGKSSFAFDTIYAEGQRRYVETFSPYARQFLDRMDKPKADKIDGIPPSIAIDQTNPVKTSRSTVGTMTELNDHLKLLFARAGQLYCQKCRQPVRRDNPDSIYPHLPEGTLRIAFPVVIPNNFTETEIRALLEKQGYRHIDTLSKSQLEVTVDRVENTPRNRARIIEALETCLKHGNGRVTVSPIGTQAPRHSDTLKFSSDLHCAACDIHYRDPQPSLFSFNSPIGACDSCRGFGRVIGIDYDLVIPDRSVSLADGAIKPWRTESYRECQDDLMTFARKRGVPTDLSFRDLSSDQQQWVLDGEGRWEDRKWYGVKRFFTWLETKSYKMHVRVLLSKYRRYTPCPTCKGSRLKPDALLWRIVTPDSFTPSALGHIVNPAHSHSLSIHDIMLMPLDQCHAFFRDLTLPAPLDDATDMLLREIRSRLQYLVDVGLGYLTLDRQSRTLSGGEVQRINLTTALGTSLVNTLFVLDEPSIGLHPRDIQRLIGVLHRLRDAGNSLLVVEHDPDVIRAADRILDMGPGPGEQGGEIVFFGTFNQLVKCKQSRTGVALRSPHPSITPPLRQSAVSFLELRGATEHNLKSVNVNIPLNRLVCVTGVSGSGKSTLIEDVLYRGLLRLKGRPTDQPGQHESILGHEQIHDVIMVDQSPIGKTTRSNPASYVGAFDAIRKLYANLPESKQRGYTAGTFSFNSGNGRCPACSGNGFQHVEMQFLSDVYLRCPDCNGRRYRPELDDVRHNGKSIADILETTVDDACALFAGHTEIIRSLEPLRAVGLGYIKLGQPVPTLSGGEAQRLKLAGHLTNTTPQHTLFLFDEPTTGLHFDDVAVLLQALRHLVTQGHSVIVIEHNLDMIRAADWIIDLGPEGGDSGGEIICTGTPDNIAACDHSHTGRALRNCRAGAPPAVVGKRSSASGALALQQRNRNRIEIHHAREHNLKNISVSIPRDKFTVITGISGSGKSTLAFDILFGEGQRRYLESLNAYARQFVQPSARPDVDAVTGIPPTVAIEQRTSRGGRKSTVATVTEVYHFLRLLFVKLGTQHCPACNVPIQSQTPDVILAQLLREHRNRQTSLFAPLVVSRKGLYKDLAVWAAKKGFSHLRVNGKLVATAHWPRLDRFKEHSIDLPVGSAAGERALRPLLALALEYGNGVVKSGDTIFSTKRACPRCSRSFPELDPRLFSYNSKHGWCPSCYGTGLELFGFDADQTGEEIWWNEWFEGQARACRDCNGQRLCPEALAVRFDGDSIAEVTSQSVTDARQSFSKLKLHGRDAEIARDILAELNARLRFLEEVGLGYLSLDRAAPTLSGGEAQRIRLAAQLGSNLRGVCYILDEPTIGLHPRDNEMLLDTLRQLEHKGNTVIVVEHDEDTIRRAEHVIDLGPGAGAKGGRLIAEGTVNDIMRANESLTGRFLQHPLQHPLRDHDLPATQRGELVVRRASLHNLKNIDVTIPLGRLVCVTGVSGSGKSTLVRDVLHDNLKALTGKRPATKNPGQRFKGCNAITGHQPISRVLEVDQTPIGKTPRSCPSTYIGFWDDIRRLFAGTTEAKMRGYNASRFSFNTPHGRCPECEGQGMKTIEMSFLPDVTVHCDVCAGKRFTSDTLAVTWKEKTIADVLAMNVDEAVDFFAAQSRIHRGLKLLQDVGLGYLTLGQQSPTLSGGEAQRIKLVTELSKSTNAATLYVLDEPTIGLHMADVEKLILVLHRLVEAGNSVVLIEHNLDVIAEADWIIDLGPEGGDGGGRIVAQGTPRDIARQKHATHTSRFLRKFLRGR